jgi:tetratricopeptide (TPR) repeat protein
VSGPGDLEALVARWLELRESGGAPDPEAFAAAHGDLGPRLLEALRKVAATEALFPADPLAIPERVGRFRVTGIIGQGGMGLVLRAEDPDRPGHPVALKLLSLPSLLDPRAVTRFQREGKALAALEHPGIVRVREVGVSAGAPFIAMDLVEGTSLARLLARARERPTKPGAPPCARLELPGAETGHAAAARVALRLAEALAAAHARGLLHRDVKPSNVIVRPDGGPVLLDFGLAGDPEAPTLTRTGDVVGTPQYMAPEQARGERAAPAADVYGLGAVLYEMLTLEPPHGEGTSREVLERARTRPPRRAVRLDPRLPGGLRTLLETALAWRPSWRHASMESMAGALRAWLEGRPVPTRPGAWLHRLAEAIRLRRRAGLAAAAALALLVAVGFAVRSRGAARERAERARSIVEGAALAWLEGAEPRALEPFARELEAVDPDHPDRPLLAGLISGPGEAATVRIEEALAAFRSAARESPDSPWPTVTLARVAVRGGRPEAALADLEAAAARAPDSAARSAAFGHALVAAGRAREAADRYATACGLRSEWTAGHEHRARALHLAGDPDGACAAARAGGEAVLHAHARFLDRREERAAARALYRELLERRPGLVEARFDLATSLAYDDARAAEREYLRVLEDDPEHARALVSLAYVCAWLCGHESCRAVLDPERAENFAVRAVRADRGGNVNVLRAAVDAARGVGRGAALDRALAELEEAEPAGSVALQHLRDARRQLAERTPAR